jgi:hypothetical protein
MSALETARSSLHTEESKGNQSEGSRITLAYLEVNAEQIVDYRESSPLLRVR